jgi:hypothetical protein
VLAVCGQLVWSLRLRRRGHVLLCRSPLLALHFVRCVQQNQTLLWVWRTCRRPGRGSGTRAYDPGWTRNGRCVRSAAVARQRRGAGGGGPKAGGPNVRRKKVYFDRAGLCEALLSWHSNHAPVTFSAIARSELITAFAGLTRIRIKVGAAIHTVRLRAGRSLGACLSGVRQDQDQTHRKAGN